MLKAILRKFFKKNMITGGWIFFNGERTHIEGPYINGKFNPKKVYFLINRINDLS